MLVCLCCPKHSSMPTPALWACWHAGMLACWPIAIQRRRRPRKLAFFAPALALAIYQHASILACWDARQQHRQTSILSPFPR